MNNSSPVKTFKKLLTYSSLYALSFVLIASVFFPHQELQKDITWIQYVIIFLSFVFLTKYLVYMVVSPWYDARWGVWKAKNRIRVEGYYPKVSVMVPAWNEEVGLLSTVKSILESAYSNLEVVVVNDGSTDSSDSIMKEFVAEYEQKEKSDKTIIYHYQENGGKGGALNNGIKLSTGEIIITIDADSVVHKNAIRNFVTCFADPEVMAAVGNVKIGTTKNIVTTIQYLEFLFSFYFKRADSIFGSIYIIGGAAGAFRKEVFEKLGMYSSKNITEDIELTVRIQEAGMKIVYVSDAIVYTEGANDTRSLIKQRLRWKRGRIDTFVQYKSLFFSTRRRHNKFLSWFVLPFAVLGDTQLLFEIPFILFLYITAFITNDYSPFLSALMIVTFVFYVQTFTPDKKYNKTNPYFLAPIGWVMFYFITLIELSALIQSLWSIYKRKEVQWQSWKRIGLTGKGE